MTDALREAYALGWRTAANWMERDDLIADIGSQAYIQDRDAALASPTEGAAEPFAWYRLDADPDYGMSIDFYATKPKEGDARPLYTAEQMQDYARAALATQQGASRLTDEQRLKEWLDDYAHVPLTAMEKRVAEEAWRAALAIQGAGNEFERGRQQGMQQERALWKLAASSQEIEGDPAGLPSAERCSGPDGESQR